MREADLPLVRARIEAVLEADAETASRDGPDARAAAMRAIDTTGCPADFAAAYVNHIFAWEYAAQIEAAMVQPAVAAEGATRDAQRASAKAPRHEAMPDADIVRRLRRLEELQGAAHDEIRSTFQRVQLIATGYGATLPD